MHFRCLHFLFVFLVAAFVTTTALAAPLSLCSEQFLYQGPGSVCDPEKKLAPTNTDNPPLPRGGVLPFMGKLDLEVGLMDKDVYGSITGVQPLWQDQSGLNHLFTQLSWVKSLDDTYASTISAGLAYRFFAKARNLVLGANIFVDHAYALNHNRLSLGLDARSGLLGFSLNRYLPLSGWKRLDEAVEERATGGWDMELRYGSEYLPKWTGFLKTYIWEGQGDDEEVYGLNAAIEYALLDTVTMRLGVRDESRAAPSAEVSLRYNLLLSEPQKSGDASLHLASAGAHIYDKVRRENRIRTSSRTTATGDRTAPSGYSVLFTTDPLDPTNDQAAAFTLSGGELGSTYDYVISSSGGGITFTGSGTVSSDPQNFINLDLSGLQDGTLTVTMTLTDTLGNIGAPATDTVVKNARFVCGTVGENGTINLSAPLGEVFTAVDFASYGTPNGACGSYTIGACHAANSSALTGAAFLGNNSGSITASNGVFGDPCGGTLKRMYVQLHY